jgi:hypothetical protein
MPNDIAHCAPRLLWGVPRIAAAINRSESQTYYLLSRGRLPARKIGDQWVAEHDKLVDPGQWPISDAA